MQFRLPRMAEAYHAQGVSMSIEALPQTNSAAPQADEAEQRSQVLSNLLKVSTYLVSVLDPHELLAGLARQVVDVVPSIQAGILWLHEPQHGGLQIKSLHGLDFGEQHEVVEQIRLRPGEGLAGTTMQRGESLLIEGRTRYRDMAGSYNPRNHAGLRALFETLPRDLTAVLLPLRIGAETIGVLELLNLGSQPPLRGQDLQVLQTFANLAAGAIKNAQFHVQMQADQRRLETFGAISTAVSSASDLNELVDNTLDVLLGVVNAAAGMLLLYNPGRMTLTVGAHRRLPDSYVESHTAMPVAVAACAEAVRYGQPISRPLIAEEQEQELIDFGLSSCVYLPLLAGGTVAGVACLYGTAPLYERVDTRALMMMGSLVGFAIANVTLYTESEVERQRLHAVIASIAEGVALCDAEGRLILSNQTAMNLLSLEHLPYGQRLSEMPDFYAVRTLEGEPMPVDQLPLARALAGEIFHDYRVLQRGASGRDTVMSFSGGPVIRNGQPQGSVVVFRDVTAIQKAERAKDDFLAVAAHELRSPLAAVRSYTDLLVRREQRRSDEDSAELRGLTILAQQVTHMLRMVDNLLDVSRLDADMVSLQLQRVNLSALAEQVLEQQRPLAGDRTLLLESEQEDLSLVCDPLRVRQVLTNLIGNAIRYSAAGTSISVSLTCPSVAELAARHPDFAARQSENGTQSDDIALIAVEDEGAGMSDEQRGQLFQRYARGRERRGEGLGLGLYLSRAFVLRHGGTIWAESRVGEGSTFFVALPLHLTPSDDEPLLGM